MNTSSVVAVMRSLGRSMAVIGTLLASTATQAVPVEVNWTGSIVSASGSRLSEFGLTGTGADFGQQFTGLITFDTDDLPANNPIVNPSPISLSSQFRFLGFPLTSSVTIGTNTFALSDADGSVIAGEDDTDPAVPFSTGSNFSILASERSAFQLPGTTYSQSIHMSIQDRVAPYTSFVDDPFNWSHVQVGDNLIQGGGIKDGSITRDADGAQIASENFLTISYQMVAANSTTVIESMEALVAMIDALPTGFLGTVDSTSGVMLDFGEVITGGEITVTQTSRVPDQFTPADSQFLFDAFTTPIVYEIDTSETLDFNGLVELVFRYDEADLLAGFDESDLVIYHAENGVLANLGGTVDAVANTITVYTSSFSPFILGSQASAASVPEPVTLTMLGLGLAAMGFSKRRQIPTDNMR